jgi:hypothetical protein
VPDRRLVSFERGKQLTVGSVPYPCRLVFAGSYDAPTIGENAAYQTVSLCPSSRTSSWPVSALHTSPVSPAAKTRWPSGENLT